MYKRGFWILLAVLMLLVLTTSVAWAAPSLQNEEDLTADPLWIALAPLLAVATACERVIERFWDLWERKGNRLNNAGVDNPKDPKYVETKKAMGHWLGFGLAVIAIALTDVRLFHLLGIDVLFSTGGVLFDLGVGGIFDDFTLGTLVDWLGTAFIIGWGGTELTHSVITGLVRGRKLWEEMQEVQKGERSMLDMQFFQGIAPKLQELGISATELRGILTDLGKVGVPIEQLIVKMIQGKAEEFLRGLEGDAGKVMLDLLEGTPEAKGPDSVRLGLLLDTIDPQLRQKYLGA